MKQKTLKLTGNKVVVQLDEKREALTLEQQVRAAQGEPQGEDWDFDVPRLQQRIDDGTVWGFEGSVGRAAMDAITSGACFLPTTPTRDYFGNRIPSRDELQPGSKGTLENSARFYGIGTEWD